jgi:hypothetical protein
MTIGSDLRDCLVKRVEMVAVERLPFGRRRIVVVDTGRDSDRAVHGEPTSPLDHEAPFAVPRDWRC